MTSEEASPVIIDKKAARKEKQAARKQGKAAAKSTNSIDGLTDKAKPKINSFLG